MKKLTKFQRERVERLRFVMDDDFDWMVKLAESGPKEDDGHVLDVRLFTLEAIDKIMELSRILGGFE